MSSTVFPLPSFMQGDWVRLGCTVTVGIYNKYSYLEAHTLTPCLGYLVSWLGSGVEKGRYPKKGVGYEPTGSGQRRESL